jgi:hypothetical protein
MSENSSHAPTPQSMTSMKATSMLIVLFFEWAEMEFHKAV